LTEKQSKANPNILKGAVGTGLNGLN